MINFSLVSSVLLLINYYYYYYYTKFTIFYYYYYYYYCKKSNHYYTITITITYYPMSGHNAFTPLKNFLLYSIENDV